MANGDFSNLVTNQKMKQVLSDCAHLDSATLGKNYTLLDYAVVGKAAYKHCCTSGPSTWYRRAGIHLSWWAHPSSATVDEMKRRLEGAGMVAVWHGTGQEANAKLNNSQVLRPGDVASMLSSDSAHGVMWTGVDWRSDCIQGKRPYPYTAKGRGGDWTFILWRHPSLQEPGMDIAGPGFGNINDSGGGGGGNSIRARFENFNVKQFSIFNDETGQYTEETIMMGIANHIQLAMGSSGFGNGDLGDEGVFTELAKGSYADGGHKLKNAEVRQRAVYCAKWLASNVNGFNLNHACAIVGVYVDENGCDPKSSCAREKAGGGTKYTQGGGYGAGIGSWTGAKSKAEKLKSIGKSPDTPIESLSLDEQLQITKKEWEKGDKFHKVMWQARDLAHASIVATYMTHGIGYFETALNAGGWDIYSKGFIDAMNAEARRQHDALQRWNHGTDSDYYYGLFHKRYLVAKALLSLCT